ncbi:benzoylformate decarboxylase [Streptomyces sp. NBC_01602]|uniref:benzoylformate decarboxylase n=1 Tax=Streptomyces sp. NBC_01602 TaxID=2975893 RepID=UPI00386CAC49|nr:benzoylformate decarboxylase [Streptomyces sp. NBC_01602]
MPTVRQATLDLFRRHGLNTWFGNPGSSELSLLEEFPDDFRYFLGLQEMVPVGMADGFAQITGRPALVNVHTAPGLGNAMGSLYNAYLNKTPLIITAGNQRRAMQNQKSLLTNEDAVLVPRPFVKWSAEPATASEVPAVLAHAIHIAVSPPTGPVFVSLPMDDMAYELTDAQTAEIDVIRERDVTHAGGFRKDLAKKIADRLSAAKAPAFVVGGDLEHAGAWHQMVKLAERCKAAVWTTPLPGLSGFPENHPLYQGLLPPGAGWVSEALKGHDLVVVLGNPVFRYYPYIPGPYLPEGTCLIHITSDPDEAARAPVGDAYVADVRAAVEVLLGEISDTSRKAPQARPEVPRPERAAAPMQAADLWSAIGYAAPPDTLFVSEAGSNEVPITKYVRPGTPRSHMSAVGGGLGFGLPAAVGAQLAAPDRPVIALMGDGSMHYAITSLWSAARYKVPLTIVVASNEEYGVLKQFGDIESAAGVPGLDLPGLDIKATAASYGVDVHEATDTDQVSDMLRAAVNDRETPTLINVRTEKVKRVAPRLT